MNALKTTSIDGFATCTLPASAGDQLTRLDQVAALLSGKSNLQHTHSLDDIVNEPAKLGLRINGILCNTPDFNWYLNSTTGILSGRSRLKPGGGIVSTADGLAVNVDDLDLPVPIVSVDDIPDFINGVHARLIEEISDTNTIYWQRGDAVLSANVRLNSVGGILQDGDGLKLRFGTGVNDVARGNHGHSQLHNPVTLPPSPSSTLSISINGQVFSAEVRISGVGGLKVYADGLGADFGPGENQIARGASVLPGSDHAPVTTANSYSISLGVDDNQVLSAQAKIDPSPSAGFGRLSIGTAGLRMILGSGSDVAASGDHVHNYATTSTAGFMSPQDKQRLNAILSGEGGLTPENCSFTREAALLSGNRLLGHYRFDEDVELVSAQIYALNPQINTPLRLEVAGVLTADEMILISGPPNIEQLVTGTFSRVIPAGSEIRWRILGHAVPGNAATMASLTAQIIRSS